MNGGGLAHTSTILRKDCTGSTRVFLGIGYEASSPQSFYSGHIKSGCRL